MGQPGSWLQRPGGSAVAATTVVGLGGFLFGYDIGIISGVLVMPSFLASFPAVARSPWVAGFVVTAFLIGGMLGALASSWLAEARGRRATLRIGAALFICGGCAQAVAGALPALFVARGVSGLAIGLTASVVPVYNSELAPAERRGAMISYNQYMITSGIMVSFWVNYFLKNVRPTPRAHQHLVELSGWRIAMLLQCLPAALLLAGSLWLPRSPRWLVQNRRSAEALAALRQLRGSARTADGQQERAVAELREIEADCRRGGDTLARWSEFVTDPPSRRRLLCGIVLQTGQMLCGIDSIMFFGPALFATAAPHVSDAGLLAQGLNGIINFISTFAAVCLLDRVGRRPLLACGAATMSLCMLTLAVVGVMYARIEDGSGSDGSAAGGAVLVIEHRAAGVVCIVAIYTYVCAFAWSWGPVVWALCTEIFPTRQRARGVSITTSTNWMWNIAVGQLYPPAQQRLGFRIFFIFSAVSASLLLWTVCCAPETRGLSIDAVERLFERRRGTGKGRAPLLQ